MVVIAHLEEAMWGRGRCEKRCAESLGWSLVTVLLQEAKAGDSRNQLYTTRMLAPGLPPGVLMDSDTCRVMLQPLEG